MPYLEHDLQILFVQWFRKQFGYREVANDAETNNATCMDSVGFIDDRPVLIEFKDRINGGNIQHSNKQGGTIELKISRGLKCLHGDRKESITEPLSEWNRKATPHIYVVANHISEEAQRILKELLQVRSQEWKFNYTVYLWNNDQPIKVSENISSSELKDGEKPQIPELEHERQRRGKKNSIEEFQQIAEDKNVRGLFDTMYLRIQNLGGVPEGNVKNLNFRFPQFHSESQYSVVGIWPSRSSIAQGLLVSYSLSLIEKCFNVSPEIEPLLPGKQPEKRIGHLGQNRYLRTPEEIDKFWDLLTGIKFI